MSPILLAEQVLNGLQSGVMLFLMAAGLTLIFGVMGLINLAHGALYMVGAFAAATVAGLTGSFLLALVAALAAAAGGPLRFCRTRGHRRGNIDARSVGRDGFMRATPRWRSIRCRYDTISRRLRLR